MNEPIPLVVTAKAIDQVTIGGLPDSSNASNRTFSSILGLKCRVLPLKIYSPYHTPLLDHEVDLVMLDLERRGLVDDSHLQPSLKALWETANADVLIERVGALRCVSSLRATCLRLQTGSVWSST